MVRINKILSHSLLLSILAASSLSAVENSHLISLDEVDMTEATLEFSPEAVRTDGLGEDIGLFYDKDGFFVRTSDDDVRVQRYDTDKLFRGRKVKDIARYSTMGKFKLSKLDNGEYVVCSHGEIKGGGLLGATVGAYVGKYGTYVVGHGGIIVASAMTGWGCVATFIALEGQLAIPIETASNVAALAGGILLGAATGPV